MKIRMLNFIACMIFLSFFSVIKAQWIQVSNGLGNNRTINAMALNGNKIFAGTAANGVFISTDEGTTWSQSSLNSHSIRAFTVSGNNIFAGTADAGVFLSTDNGVSWSQTSLNNLRVYALTVHEGNIFAGVSQSPAGVYISTDNGASWTRTSLTYFIYSLTSFGNTIFAGTGNGGPGGFLYLSTDNGTNWIQTSLYWTVYSIGINNNHLFAGTHYGVYESTNNGFNWSITSFPNYLIVQSIAVAGSNIVAGTYMEGVYFSSDSGLIWTDISDSLSGWSIWSLFIYDNYIFAGTGSHSVWKRNLNELVPVKPVSNELPVKYTLSQNYPNPFNPSTRIKFSLPKSSFVKLIVYDVTGRKVQTLVHENLNAGSYEKSFDASGLSSGVYIYKIETQDFEVTKKMVLVK